LSAVAFAGIRTAAGVVLGQAVWALAASAGVAALLVASEPAFVALKLAGAAYLVYLGGQALISAMGRGQAPSTTPPQRTVVSCARVC
jgi:threonine/homoserine/homoserine lactone efflux protein